MKNVILCFAFIFGTALAQSPDLTIPSESQLKAILKDFSGNMVPSTATGAHSANLMGFEFGLVASTIESPNLEAEDSDIDKLANAGLYAKLEIPFGLGAEIIHAPFKTDDLDYNYTSVAGAISFSGTFFDTKLKLFVINSTIEFTDSSSAVVSYKNQGYGTTLTFGKKFLIIEPYVGVGYVDSESTMTATASAVFGGSTYVQNLASAGISESDVYFYGGLDLDLLFVSVGLEVSNPYGNNKIAGRLAFGF